MIMSQQFGASVSGQWQFDFCKLNVYISKINFKRKLRCFNVRTPLLGLQLEAESFMQFHVQKFNRSRVRRNVGLPFLQGLMLTLAQKTGKHILRTVISKVHGSADQILNSIGTQLIAGGFSCTKIRKQKGIMVPAEGMERIIKKLNALQGLTKLGNLRSIENDILLLQNIWRVLKDFYKKVFDSDHPLNATIQKFVGNKTF